MKLCILISAYNEAKHIKDVIEGAREFGEVIVVNDGSSDDTAYISRKAGAEVISHTTNRGKGAAIMTGLDAFLKGDRDQVLLMDGDGQHLPSDIKNFVSVYQQGPCPMIIGNRMFHSDQMPIVRRWTNRFMSKLLSMGLGVRVSDTQCGFRLLERSLVQKLDLLAKRFEIESELFIQVAHLGAEIKEVNIEVFYGDESSQIRPVKDTIRFFKLLIRNLYKRKR